MINHIFQTVLSLSVSGSSLAFLLFLIRLLTQKKLGYSWYYAILVLVILRFLIPFGIPVHSSGRGITDSGHYSQEPALLPNPTEQTPSASPGRPESDAAVHTESEFQQTMKDLREYTGKLPIAGIMSCLSVIWLLVSIFLIVRKAVSYHRFLVFVKANRTLIEDRSILSVYEPLCSQMSIRWPVLLYSVKLSVSPMYIGCFHPFIIVPEKALAQPLYLSYILRHELTHYKHRDVFYKWLTQLALSIHWFNPVLFIISKQINKACELACDEAIMKTLTKKEQREYGDTLLNSLQLARPDTHSILTLTFSENIKLMKERLGAIMNYQKKSMKTAVLSAILTAALCFSAMFTTSYADSAMQKETTKAREDPAASKAELFTIDLPSVEDDIYVESYGNYALLEDGSLSVKLDWKGEGNVMFLYTEENFSADDIKRLLNKGILPSPVNDKTFGGHEEASPLSSNFTYDTKNKSLHLNFITSPSQPVTWNNTVPKTAGYYFYMIVMDKKEISNIHGTVTYDTMAKDSTLPRMDSWTGSCKEEKTAKGCLIKTKEWTGDKISYSYEAREGETKTFHLNSYLYGSYQIVFVTDDRTILETVPAFTGEKEITLTNLPKGNVNVILYSQSADGSLYIN